MGNIMIHKLCKGIFNIFFFCILFFICVAYSASLGYKSKKSVLIPHPSHNAQQLNHKNPKYRTLIQKGSLEENIVRTAKRFNLNRVIWQLPNNYIIHNSYYISGNSFTEILLAMLKPLPSAMAIYYKTNKTLVILPRQSPL